jgi:hypothetical protein
LRFAGEDTLKQQQLSESDFMDFDLEDVFEMSLAFSVVILFLQTDLSIIIELKGVQDVVGLFNLEIVWLAQ